MTVKEICSAIKCAKIVSVVVCEDCYDLWKEGCSGYIDVMLDAFGDYVADQVFATKEDCFEISVLTKPVRKGNVA